MTSTEPVQATETSESERVAFLKIARHAALSADQMCSSLLKMSERLEKAKIIDPERPSKKLLGHKLRHHSTESSASDKEIEALFNQIKDHPDPENIVSSLFRGLAPAKVKKVAEPKSEAAADTDANKADAAKE